MRQTVDARLINGLWIFIYVDRIKPERKWCWLQIYAGIIIWGLFPMLSNYTSINELVSVWFYFIIIFIIEFVLMIFNMKIAFWWSVNGFWYENRITNKSSPSLSCHTSDKSFLLWKRNLWCIIWFSLWKWPFILYGSCYSRGAPVPFRFMVGVSSGRGESESLVVFLFEKTYFTQANYICRYLDLFLWWLVNRESDYSSRHNSQPGITARPRITADD